MDDQQEPILNGRAICEFKVVELKEELGKRGLSKIGTKIVLYERLKEHLISTIAASKQAEQESAAAVKSTSDESGSSTANPFVAEYLAKQQVALMAARKDAEEARRAVSAPDDQTNSPQHKAVTVSKRSDSEKQSGTPDKKITRRSPRLGSPQKDRDKTVSVEEQNGKEFCEVGERTADENITNETSKRATAKKESLKDEDISEGAEQVNEKNSNADIRNDDDAKDELSADADVKVEVSKEDTTKSEKRNGNRDVKNSEEADEGERSSKNLYPDDTKASVSPSKHSPHADEDVDLPKDHNEKISVSSTIFLDSTCEDIDDKKVNVISEDVVDSSCDASKETHSISSDTATPPTTEPKIGVKETEATMEHSKSENLSEEGIIVSEETTQEDDQSLNMIDQQQQHSDSIRKQDEECRKDAVKKRAEGTSERRWKGSNEELLENNKERVVTVDVRTSSKNKSSDERHFQLSDMQPHETTSIHSDTSVSLSDTRRRISVADSEESYNNNNEDDDMKEKTEELDYEEVPQQASMSSSLEKKDEILCSKVEVAETSTRRISSSNEVIHGSDDEKNVTIDGFVRQRSVSPARYPVNQVLMIRQLTRPFTSKQLQQMLATYGTIVENGFWIDNIKSTCIVKYSTIEEAIVARGRLHNVVWPIHSPKALKVDYSDDEGLAKHIASDATSASTASAVTPKAKRSFGGVPSSENVMATSTLRISVSVNDEQRSVQPSATRSSRTGHHKHNDNASKTNENASDRKKPHSKSPPGRSDAPSEKRSRQERRDLHSGERKHRSSPEAKQPIQDAEKSVKTADELFKKTVTQPSIYYVALTDEQIIERTKRKQGVETCEMLSEKKSADGAVSKMSSSSKKEDVVDKGKKRLKTNLSSEKHHHAAAVITINSQSEMSASSRHHTSNRHRDRSPSSTQRHHH
uniref:Apoptotic chromatin condensation inducer in the nucleus n=1 Tax=Anisakis pegreffii TaxID=303229 RepID=A0A3G6JBB6_9BILA|nr:apoptotic chromatin condensation inducer in the nucleus [Anisakis pegreffii]